MIAVDVELSQSELNFLNTLMEAVTAGNAYKTGAGNHIHKPHFLHLCGIPGSGKSTYAANWIKRNPHYYLVQFDSIMESLPGYETLAGSCPQEAFLKFELPARAIGYKLLECLVENRRSILFDHSAANRNHPALIKTLAERGYAVEMHWLDCSPELACLRVKDRALKNKRHTPESLVYERAQILDELLPIYRSLTSVVEIRDGETKVQRFLPALR